jgi:DNA polymerase (family 10)
MHITDFHSAHGIGQARRGWLEKGDVINTRNFSELKKLIRKRK